MSLGDKPTEGNKKSNYSFQSKNVGILARISASVALGATEATLISVLNAIVASDQDLEILLVRDVAVGNGDPVLRQVTNWETGVPVITYENVDGTTYVPAPNPVPVYVYLDPSAVLQLILSEMLDQGLTLDDIELNTDGINLEVTQLLIKGVLDAIKLDTANLDVTLSSRWNTLGQKVSASSAPVVLSTEQEAILQAIVTAVGLGATEATLLLTNALLTTIDADTSNMVGILTAIDSVLDAIKVDTTAIAVDTAAMAANIDASTWDTTIGNTKVLAYYAGTQPGHPATSTSEVETIEFRNAGGATLIFTQTFTYDAANNVLTIVVT